LINEDSPKKAEKAGKRANEDNDEGETLTETSVQQLATGAAGGDDTSSKLEDSWR